MVSKVPLITIFILTLSICYGYDSCEKFIHCDCYVFVVSMIVYFVTKSTDYIRFPLIRPIRYTVVTLNNLVIVLLK